LEIWAYCGTCERWFYCEGSSDVATPQPTCPVCTAQPRVMENRAAASGAPERLDRWADRCRPYVETA
jgi:hypothetical protein